MDDLLAIQESITPRLVASEGKDWDAVVIQPGISKNGFYYSPDVLRESVPLFDGVRVCAFRFGGPLQDGFNHLPDRIALMKPEGLAENTVGWLKNPRYGKYKAKDGTTGEGILARLHVLEGHDWLRRNLKDAWENGHPNILGLSIDAHAKARPGTVDGQAVKIVEKIMEVQSTDVVTNPAAGGGLVRLVAGIAERASDMKTIYDLIAEHRGPWLEGFEPPAESADMKAYCLNVLESVKAQGEDYQSSMQAAEGAEDQHLLEVARGVRSLNQVIALLKDGKVEDAVKMLRNWIAVYPMPEKGSAESRQRGFVSFPYGKPETGYPGAGKLKPYGEPAKATASADPEPAPEAEQTTPPEPTKTEEETAMDDAEKAKLEEERAQLQAREAELAKRERDIRVGERVKASDLPDEAKERVIASLSAREGELSDEQVDEQVAKERDYIAKLREAAKETGADDGKPKNLGNAHQEPKPRVEVGQAEQDRWPKAMEGMFNGDGQPVDGVDPFFSLHEAFGEICGRNIRQGGWLSNEEKADMIFAGIKMAFPRKSRARSMERHIVKIREGWNPYKGLDGYAHIVEATGTGDFSIAFGDALNKRLQKDFATPALNDWRKIISGIESLNDLTNTFRLVQMGYTGILPDVNEKAPYEELSPEAGEVVENMVPKKKGGLWVLTWEAILADQIGVIRAIPRRLGRSSARTIQQLVFDQIETNPDMTADSVALINAAHNNLISGNPALSYADVATAIKQLQDQAESSSTEKLGLEPMFLLVGPEKHQKAVEIADSNVKTNTAEDSTLTNYVKSRGLEVLKSIGIGRSASTKYRWYVLADPRDTETIVVGFLGGRDRPDIFVQSPIDTPTAGASFEADSLTFKVRLGCAAKAANFQFIQGSLATS